MSPSLTGMGCEMSGLPGCWAASRIMNLFSTPIGRLAFLGRNVVALLPMLVGGVIWAFAKPHHNVILMLVALVFEILGIVYLVGFTYFPRLVSIGLSKWFTLLLFIPYVGFVFLAFLLFCPAGKFIKHDNAA